MVLSDRLGPVALGRSNGNVFMGRDIASDRDFSNETAAAIDEEVRNYVDQAYSRAKKVLIDNRHILDRLAEMLIEKETVEADELQNVLAENDVKNGNFGLNGKIRFSLFSKSFDSTQNNIESTHSLSAFFCLNNYFAYCL